MIRRRSRPSGVRLLLLRHGQTEWNVTGRYQGSTDTALSPRGWAQAQAAASALEGEGIGRILCSPLRRARETAEAATASLRDANALLSLEAEPRIAEICFGEWEGLTYADIVRRYPEAADAWRRDPVTCAPPAGETLAEVASRVGQVLDELRQAPPGECVLLVAHGGSLSVLLCLALGLPPDRRWQLGLSHGALSELHLYPEGAILTRHNDTHHLRALQALESLTSDGHRSEDKEN